MFSVDKVFLMMIVVVLFILYDYIRSFVSGPAKLIISGFEKWRTTA